MTHTPEPELSAKTFRILLSLADGKRHREDMMPRASFDYLQCLYFQGLITGAGRDDDRGAGNYKYTRYWWLTENGRAALARAEGKQP